MTVSIIVNGANGKMGRVTSLAIERQNDMRLLAKGHSHHDLNTLIQQHQPDVVIDFTTPRAVFNNAKSIIAANCRAIIGTTGLTHEQINELSNLCQQKKLGAIIAPNFSISAILMMRYAKDAAKYFTDAEIIEYHHPQKKDAPSGTAIKTAQLMAENRQAIQQENHPQASARGELHSGYPIHSVRLPSLIAHQTVMFAGSGETLTIRSDSMNRECFMPGVILACQKVIELDHLVYGLENLL